MRKAAFFCVGLCLLMIGQRLPARAAGAPTTWTDKDEAKFKDKLEKRTKRRLRIVSSELKLTPDQQASVLKILEARNDEMAALEKDYRQKRATLRSDTQQQFLPVFTDEQRDLYENGEGQKGGTRLHDQQPGRYVGGGLDED